MRGSVIASIAVLIILLSCQNSGRVEGNGPGRPSEKLEEDLIRANKGAVKTEDEQIEDLIRRYGWDMKTTPSGLRYSIDKSGYGERISEGKLVKMEYVVKLITGDVVYSSDDDGVLELYVGRDDAVAGLHEGAMLLREGSEAKFILPSHLAYGLIGDGDRIRQKATLIYLVKVIEVK